MFTYQTHGTCSTQIQLEIENGIITFCQFTKGCKGNTAALSKLVVGLKAEDVASRLSGISCQGNTSCPDQLAQAIKAYQTKQGQAC